MHMFNRDIGRMHTSDWEGLNLTSTVMVSRGPRVSARDQDDRFELVKKLRGRVFSLAKHLTQNDDAAEDVLIAAFLEASSNWDRCDEEETLWIRLVTITVKEALLWLNSRGERRPFPEACEDVVIREFSVWGNSNRQWYAPEQTGTLEAGLRSLDPMCRTVFVLRDIEEFPVEQIANILRRSVAAVEVCLLRARLQLREALASQMRQQR